MKKLFGTDGVRGKVNEFLTEELAENVGRALGAILTRENAIPRVVIGGDTRESYAMLMSALAKGLTEHGVNVYEVGTLPTPAIAYLTANENFDAGIMISASHNPYEYNGIKIFAGGGFKLSDENEEEIEQMIYEGRHISNADAHGKFQRAPELLSKYIDYMKTKIPQTKLDIFAVIDCANGSSTATAKDIFSFLGNRTLYLGVSPDGRNINDGCGSTHLDLLAEKVKELHADIGIAFDGDADRFLAIDESGNEVDGDYILAILAKSLFEKGKLTHNTVVGTVMTNYGFSKFAEKHGFRFIPTRVGDRYVLEEIEKCGYALGGEQSGHTIIREAATTGDGQLTALYLLARMAETGKPLSALADIMQRFPQCTINVNADENGKALIKTDSRIAAIIDDARIRLGEDGRILVRPSGTEPVVRIMVESLEPALAKSICEDVSTKITELL